MSSGAIDIDEFENADTDSFEERTDLENIVLFLDKHDDWAWKAATVAERFGLEKDAISSILSRLKERGFVRHKRPYWAITDDKDDPLYLLTLPTSRASRRTVRRGTSRRVPN